MTDVLIRDVPDDIVSAIEAKANGEAIRADADYLVVGAPIRDDTDPVAAARDVVAAIDRGLAARRRV